MSIRQELAQFCAELTYDSLPADVIEYTKFCFLDHVACMLAAPGAFADEFPAPDIAKFIQQLGGKEESGIMGSGGKF